MTNYLRLYAIDIPIFSLACANNSILVGIGCFKERARTAANRRIARLVLIILFVEVGLSVPGAIMGMIGASIVELITCSLYARPRLFSRSAFPFRRLLGFGAPLVFSALSLSIFRLDLFALKVLGGTAAIAGFYAAARNFSIPIALFSNSLSPPLLSTLSRLLNAEEETQAREIGQTAVRSIVWLLPFAAMTAGAASEIVCFVFGEKYLPASPILSLLIFAAIGLLAINISKVILTAVGRPGWTFLLSGPMVPLALIGHLILIPWFGGVGAAFVTASVALLGAIASLYAVYRIWRVFPPLKTILIGTFCSGLAFALAILWSSSGIMLVFKLVVIILIILLTFLILGEFTKSEIALIRSLFQRRVDIGESKGRV